MVDLIPINRRKMNTNQPTNHPEHDDLAYHSDTESDDEVEEANH